MYNRDLLISCVIRFEVSFWGITIVAGMCVCVFVLFFGVFFGGGGGGAPMCRVKLRTVKQGTSLKGIEVYGQSVVIIHNTCNVIMNLTDNYH